MNILLVNQQGNSIVSGVASHFENIANTLLSMGHTVERLIAKDKQLHQGNRLVKTHIFKRISLKPNPSGKWRRERILKNRKHFEDALKKTDWGKIDLVITSNDIRIPILVKYFDREKIVTIIPSSLSFSPICNPSGYLKVVRRLKKTLPGVHVVVLSKKMKSMLVGLLGKKQLVSVVPPGVNLKNFLPISRKDKSNKVLYVGRLAEEKAVPALIEAFSKTKNDGQLVIVGDGEEFSKIKKLAQRLLVGKKITFVGRKENVAKYYSSARVFVLPSQYEAFGLVILEAMASGLPVIAFQPNRRIITASDEIISNGLDGFLVKNTLEMAKKIDLLLGDNQLQAKMSRQARRRAQGFTWKKHVATLLKLSKKI